MQVVGNVEIQRGFGKELRCKSPGGRELDDRSGEQQNCRSERRHPLSAMVRRGLGKLPHRIILRVVLMVQPVHEAGPRRVRTGMQTILPKMKPARAHVHTMKVLKWNWAWWDACGEWTYMMWTPARHPTRHRIHSKSTITPAGRVWSAGWGFGFKLWRARELECMRDTKPPFFAAWMRATRSSSGS